MTKRNARSTYRVEFDFSESAFKFKPTYDSLAAFDADLQAAALLAPRGGAYVEKKERVKKKIFVCLDEENDKT